jgi:hypothetical protein
VGPRVDARFLRSELLDGPDADAVKLCELDDANAGLEIRDDGGSPVGWKGRAAEPNAGGAGASLPGKDTFADHLTFKFSEHARHVQQRLSARSRRVDGLRVKLTPQTARQGRSHASSPIGE